MFSPLFTASGKNKQKQDTSLLVSKSKNKRWLGSAVTCLEGVGVSLVTSQRADLQSCALYRTPETQKTLGKQLAYIIWNL